MPNWMSRKKRRGRSQRMDAKHHIAPPESTRYCMQCKLMRIFRYDPGPGHSRCIVCGWRFIPREARQ